MSYSNEFLRNFRPVFLAILKAQSLRPERVELVVIDEEQSHVFEPADVRDVLEQIGDDLNYLTVYTGRPAYFSAFAERMYEENGLVVMVFPKTRLSAWEGQAGVRDAFLTRKLTPEMADLMREAFENGWIDFYPRKGKEGGAFCAGAMWLKQSRILTNYDGYFGSVDTLAHELGHAFHNRQIENHAPLNQDYPMPVAETASTFNEVHLGKAARTEASGEELLNLLENDIKEQITPCTTRTAIREEFFKIFWRQRRAMLLSDMSRIRSKKSLHCAGLQNAMMAKICILKKRKN